MHIIICMTIGYVIKIMVGFRKKSKCDKISKNIQIHTKIPKKHVKIKDSEIHDFQYQVHFKYQIFTTYRTDIHMHAIIHKVQEVYFYTV